ncbi:MAG: plasmid mobilization protein [Acidiferrobacteraceae bacterium]
MSPPEPPKRAPRIRLEFRCDPKARDHITEQAGKAGLTVSAFLRRVALGRVVPSIVDQAMVGELRRVGALLKHLYPHNAYWTLEEKRRWWATHELLIQLAARIEAARTRHTGE